MSRPIAVSAEFESFEEFWRFYLDEHRHPHSRALHYAGTAATLAMLAAAVAVGRWWPLLLCPLVGYGPAWAGHFFVERNRPASFRYPLWSIRAEFRMFFLFLAGRLRRHLTEAARTAAPVLLAAQELAAAA